MPLEANDEALLTNSLDRLQSDFDRFSTPFFDALFRRAPELREMFREDLAGQGMKFITTLREVILNAKGAESEAETLAELGAFHATIGVTVENFAPMEEALIETMRQKLGDEFSPELETAWRKAYADIASTMITTGGIS